MSIARVTSGHGYRYLMQSVAAGDGALTGASAMTRYYAQSGNPPGVWLGAGLAGLDGGGGLSAGSTVSEEQMFRLFGMGYDPVTGAEIGRWPYRIRASGRAAVAGFDLTFSAPKSVSALWAVADREVQEVVVAAHHAAVQACIGLLEEEVAATRIGTNGVAQADVRGLIGAGFDHWDSRAGDPQLHTHVVVANRVQRLDHEGRPGAWGTLDSRALYRSVVAISETYNGLLADELSTRLGVSWEARARRVGAAPAWEITDVPAALVEEFSQRTRAIDAHKDDLIARFRDAHGREPSTVEVLRLRQQATLATRPNKQHHSLAELCTGWRERASRVLGRDAPGWARGVTVNARETRARGVAAAAELSPQLANQLARSVLTVVEGKRSTWSRWNLHAEASRQLMGHRFMSSSQRLAATNAVVARAIAASVVLTPPVMSGTPERFRRVDGSSMFAHRHAQIYTSSGLLRAEAALLDALADTTGPTVAEPAVEAALVSPPPGHRYVLGESQRAAVVAVAGSGRVVDVLVGAAGTGKTAALAGLRGVWEQTHGAGSVVGLAPSATAADVLASDLGVATENTAKWLTEHAREGERLAEIDQLRGALHRGDSATDPAGNARLRDRLDRLVGEVAAWRLHPGQLLIVDEASLAGTLVLARIVDHARSVGAKVLLVGDPAQLSSVEAGGGFGLLVREHPTPAELLAVRRFTHSWERDATRRLRAGDEAVLDTYMEHQRVRGGTPEAMLEAAHQAWRADENSGLRSLLIAADADTVRDLNTRVRGHRVTTGDVEDEGVALRDGTVAGVGDRVVTRRNDRTLTTGHGFVKNGDTWTVTARTSDGSITVRRLTGGATITLPAAYVAEHVELGYATTAHRAQGVTVDTAHAVITPTGATRESLYVAMTRARQANTVYVLTHADDPTCTPLAPAAELDRTAREVLAAVLRRQGAEPAAHQAMREEQDQAVSIARLADEYDTIAAAAQDAYWTRCLTSAGLTAEQVAAVHDSPSYGALTTALRRADATGLHPEQALPQLVASRGLGDAEDPAAVLHDRVTRWATAQSRRADPERAELIAGLIPAARHVDDPHLQQALAERAELIEQRALALVDKALNDGEQWIQPLGEPSADPWRQHLWTSAAATVAAYRDRYPHDTDRPTPEDTAGAENAYRLAATLGASAASARASIIRSSPRRSPSIGL